MGCWSESGSTAIWYSFTSFCSNARWLCCSSQRPRPSPGQPSASQWSGRYLWSAFHCRTQADSTRSTSGWRTGSPESHWSAPGYSSRDCQQWSGQCFQPTARSLRDSRRICPVLKVFMVVLLFWYVVSSTLQVFDMDSREVGEEASKRNGEATEAMRFRLCFEMGDVLYNKVLFLHQSRSINRR